MMFRATLFAAGLLLAPLVHAEAAPVQRVVSPGGIEAWLVESHATPLFSLSFAFRGGSALDPQELAGLAGFAAATMDEGAGDLDSQAFQTELTDNAIELGFSAERDAFEGSLKTLTDRQDKAVELLRAALIAPRFDPEPVERVRGSLLARAKRDSVDPNAIAGRSLAAVMFPGHPYGRGSTTASLSRITIADLRGFAKERLRRDGLVVAAAGAIDRETLGRLLDRVFGGLPAGGSTGAVADVTPQGAGRTILLERPIPQTIMLMAGPGIRRDDPDWYPAYVMNHILGGGGFSSRLMDEVREKRGLTYGVSSHLLPWDHSALILATASTKNENAGQALDLIRAEWRRMAEGGVTAEELEGAKSYLVSSLVLQLTNTNAISGFLLRLALDHLPLDYLDRREAYFNAVTAADVARAAKRLLDPDRLTTILVGQPKEITPTERMDQPPGL